MTYRIEKKKVRLVRVESSRQNKASGVDREKGSMFTDQYGQMIFMKY